MALTSKIDKAKPTEMIRYPLASAARRIGCKILDILFVGIIIFSLGLAIFATEPGFDWHQLQPAQPWRYAIFVVLMLIVFFGLLLVLPKFTKWTLAMKLLRTKYVNVLPLSNFFRNLFKHELLIWEIMCFVSFVLGITLSLLPSQSALSMIYGVMVSKNVEQIKDWASYYGGITFACFYYACIVMLVVILVGVCIKNKRPAFHDKFSNVLVIYLSPISKLDKQANAKKRKVKRINYGIPGEINSGSFEEVDNLE